LDFFLYYPMDRSNNTFVASKKLAMVSFDFLRIGFDRIRSITKLNLFFSKLFSSCLVTLTANHPTTSISPPPPPPPFFPFFSHQELMERLKHLTRLLMPPHHHATVIQRAHVILRSFLKKTLQIC
jgi:hypothetical protein